MKYARAIEVDRASVDPESGSFRAVVFTDGEASDGHILNIAGGDIPERMPLFVNHRADPTTQLGSLYPESVTAHQVVMRGEIFLGGDGSEQAVRHDLLAKMAAGHVSQMSGRWDAMDEHVRRRTELPEDHPAYVSPKKAQKDFRLRFGLYFEKWRALEGSVVGLGADPKAVMRWAKDPEAEPSVREFWRAQIDPEEEPPADSERSDPPRDGEEPEVPDETTERTEGAPEEPTREARLAAFAAYVRELYDGGLTEWDLREELFNQSDDEPRERTEVMEFDNVVGEPITVEAQELRERTERLEAELAELRTRLETPPAQPSAGLLDGIGPREIQSVVASALAAARREHMQAVRAYIDERRGDRPRGEREALVSALRERIFGRREPETPPEPEDTRSIAERVRDRLAELRRADAAVVDSVLREALASLESGRVAGDPPPPTQDEGTPPSPEPTNEPPEDEEPAAAAEA